MRTRKLDNYLRTYRKRSGYSQETLSYLLGAGTGDKAYRYERSDRDPNFETMLALKIVYGAPLDELFPGRYARVQTKIRRRVAILKRRLGSQPQNARTLWQLESLERISKTPQ